MGALTWIAFSVFTFFVIISAAINVARPKKTPAQAVALTIAFFINVALIIILGFAAGTLVSLGA